MKKVLITATVQSHIAQFHKPLIKLLMDNNYEVHVAAKNNLAEKNGLELNEPDKVFDLSFSRNPLSISNLGTYKKLKDILDNNNYDIVHCNTPMGGVITRLAAKKMRKKGLKVFYTAHGFHFYKGSSIKSWLIYYPIEKCLARHTDKLITINKEDFDLANEKKFKTNTYRIHGVGANNEKYSQSNANEIGQLRAGLSFDKNDFICVCSGELNRNKNQEVLIEAAKDVVKVIKNFRLILAGNGKQGNYLKKKIDKLCLADHVKLVGYRTDLDTFVKSADIVLSSSIREGLGLNLIEGMICGKPIIASINRGHKELVQENVNGYLVNAKSAKEFSEKIINIYNDRGKYSEMSINSLKLSMLYTKSNVINELKEIYSLMEKS